MTSSPRTHLSAGPRDGTVAPQRQPAYHGELAALREAAAVLEAVAGLVEAMPAGLRPGPGMRLQCSARSILRYLEMAAAGPAWGERLHHLSLARGALAELDIYLTEAENLGYMGCACARQLERGCDRLCRLIGRAVLALHASREEDVKG